MTRIHSLAVNPVMPTLESMASSWKDDWDVNPFYVYYPDFERTATMEAIREPRSLLLENLRKLRDCRNANLHVRAMTTDCNAPGIQFLLDRGLLVHQHTL